MATNLEIVRAAAEAFRRGDIPAVLDACADSVDVIFRGDSAIIPFAGHWTGKGRVAEYFRVIGETTDVLRWDPRNYVGSGDRVALFGSMDLRVKATGVTITNTDWALDFTVGGGKITGWQVYTDTAALEKAYGAKARASA